MSWLLLVLDGSWRLFSISSLCFSLRVAGGFRCLTLLLLLLLLMLLLLLLLMLSG